MKKNRLAIATGILATTVVVLVAATHETNNRVCTKYTDISAYGVNQFIAMENVDDARDFRINNYTIEYIPRQKKSNTDKRIIFHKKFLQNK